MDRVGRNQIYHTFAPRNIGRNSLRSNNNEIASRLVLNENPRRFKYARLSARPLCSESFQRKRREVLASPLRSLLDVSDHHTHTLLGIKLDGWTEL